MKGQKTMARKTTPVSAEEWADTEVDQDLISTAPDDWAFETVAEESPTRVVFDTVGDVFIGQFKGRTTIAPDPASENQFDEFDLYTFRGRDGELYAVNTSAKLESGMSAVKLDDWVRLTLVKTIPVKKGNDLKDFRVEVRRN